jgi:hypothetical protein
MTDPDRNHENPRRNDATLWVLMGLMALVVVGGLAYGFSYPSFNPNNSAQTTGSGAGQVRPGHPL